jgi:enediyne biosynthesis thioesterase
MHLASVAQNRVTMLFEYFKVTGDSEDLVARGEQQIACMRREGGRLVPVPVPAPLAEALEAYSGG